MIKIADSEMAAVILNQNLWGFGEKRLGKLPPEVVVHLCNALLKTTPKDPKDQIAALLEAKKRLPTPTRAATPAPLTHTHTHTHTYIYTPAHSSPFPPT